MAGPAKWIGGTPDLPWRLRVRTRKVKTGANRHGKGSRMALGLPPRRKEPLYVLPMALALALAAFLGGALGLIWHAAGFSDDEQQAHETAPTDEQTRSRD